MGVFGAAGRLTAAGSGINGTNLGAANGLTETHLLTALESGLPAHSHTSGVRQSNNNYAAGSRNGTLTGTGINTGTVAAAPATNAHNNVQPTIILNYIIKV
jgi:microcystin-dependent protein